MAQIIINLIITMARRLRRQIDRRFDSVDRQLDELRGLIDPTEKQNKQVEAMLEAELQRAANLDALQRHESPAP